MHQHFCARKTIRQLTYTLTYNSFFLILVSNFLPQILNYRSRTIVNELIERTRRKGGGGLWKSIEGGDGQQVRQDLEGGRWTSGRKVSDDLGVLTRRGPVLRPWLSARYDFGGEESRRVRWTRAERRRKIHPLFYSSPVLEIEEINLFLLTIIVSGRGIRRRIFLFFFFFFPQVPIKKLFFSARRMFSKDRDGVEEKRASNDQQ